MQIGNHATRNDVIMMSLPKTMGKCGPPGNQTNINIIRNDMMGAIQKCNFYGFWDAVSKIKTFISNLTMSTHQIWSCHVTLAAKLQKLLFLAQFYIKF